MKVNLIIPKRNRNERISICLHYLNIANREQKHDVELYIVDDAEHVLNFAPYSNLKINYLVRPCPHSEGFRQALLLNYGLENSRKDFDWFSFLDLDLVYHPNFFEIIHRHIEGPTYVVCKGHGLDELSTKSVFENLPSFEEIKTMTLIPFSSNSQISCSKMWHDRYQQIFQTPKLSRDEFKGWGHEDSLLDLLAGHFYRDNLGNKIVVEGLYFHLHHERNINPELEKQNRGTLYRLDMENRRKIREFVRTHRPQTQANQLFDRARLAYQQGQLQQAEQLFQQVIAQAPQHDEALHLLGLLYSQTGRQTQAIDFIQRSIGVGKHRPEFYNNLGEVWRLMGNLTEAIKNYKQAIEINLFFPDAHYNLANIFKQQGKLNEAVKHYEWALGLNPDYVGAHYNLGNSQLALAKLDEAAASYQRVIELKPDHGKAHYNLGTVFQQQSQRNKAIECYRRALKIDPNFALAQQNLDELLRSSEGESK